MISLAYRADVEADAKERQKLSEGRGKKGPATLPDLNGDTREILAKRFGIGMVAE